MMSMSHSLCVFYTWSFCANFPASLGQLVHACEILPLKLTLLLLLLHHVCSALVFVCLFPHRVAFSPTISGNRHINQNKHQEEKTSEVNILLVKLTTTPCVTEC